MARKRKRKRVQRTSQIQVSLDPNVPTYDYLEHTDLDSGYVDEVLNNLIKDIKSGSFLRWEAVMRQEQGLRLTRKDKKLLSDLLWFGDTEDDHIWYIDEIPRPSELWYTIAQKIASHMLVEPFRTTDGSWWGMYEGWPTLVEVLEEHGQDLSLPPGAESPLDIFPIDLQHRLWLQTCFDNLSGLGQEDELTLENEDQRDYRMKWFIRDLKEHKDAVQYLNLTLDDLLARVIMPPKDEKIFVEIMMEQLKMPSRQHHLADFL
ncbi:MAG: hypothetical protein GY847_37090 [Proteobacteria bacterium]|nr:hypothetical protein [Pseudomonadota bacterium]